VEVQWMMQDGSRQWFAGTVTRLVGTKRRPFVMYDDGGAAGRERWRACPAPTNLVAAAVGPRQRAAVM
jgi:hypothetical protein